MSDGKVVISTALDNGGIENGVKTVSGAFGGLPNVLNKTSKAITDAFSKPVAIALAKVRSLEREYNRVTDEFNNAKLADNDAAAEKYGRKQTQIYDKLLAARERLSIEVQSEAKKQADAEEKQSRRTADSAKKASTSVSRFGSRLKSVVSGALVFNIISSALRKFTQYLGQTVASTDEMKSALSNLKGAASTAFAPVIEIITPAISRLTNALATAIAKVAGFISVLTGRSISSMKETAKTIDKVSDAATAAKKSLAGFDEINALSDTGKENGSAESISPNYNFVDSVNTSLEPLSGPVGQGLVWFWENAITPFTGWAEGSLIPAALDLVSQAIGFLGSIIEGAKPALLWIWEHFFVPIRDFIWDAVIDFLNMLTDAFSTFSDWARNNQGAVALISTTVLGFLAGLWVYNTAKKIIPFFTDLSKKFIEFATTGLTGAASAGLFALGFAVLLAGIVAVSAAWGKMSGAQKVITILGALAAAAIAAAIAIAVFQSSWTVGIAAAAIAGGIALLIGAFSALGTTDFSSILSGSSSVDASSIDPNQFGGSGGFPLPALAQGAVLPPNKPFMAVVGDQRHGTNIEAPLATIQEAVALVMQDQTQAILAGFEASVGVQREILEAVLGIQIGDDVIGNAVSRYSQKQAVMRGGAL